MHLANIAFQGGTHGNYLHYCLDKFSTLTKDIEDLPFDQKGTSHKQVINSRAFTRYHPHHNPAPYFTNPNEPHILITVSMDDILFLERTVTIRANNYNVDTNQNKIQVHDKFLDAFSWRQKFESLYNINFNNNDKIPRFLIRDFYKLSFLNPTKNGFIENDKKLKQHKPDNTFLFPVENFWNKEKFLDTLKDLDQKFRLQLEIDEKIHDMFLDQLIDLETKDRANNIVEAIQNNQDIDITNIDTVEQAYISAWIEKNNDYILIPMCNQFFESTGEIIEWIKQYPQHYKAMNPNLPIYKGKANPFYLHEKQK